jgi:hypothetical protein
MRLPGMNWPGRSRPSETSLAVERPPSELATPLPPVSLDKLMARIGIEPVADVVAEPQRVGPSSLAAADAAPTPVAPEVMTTDRAPRKPRKQRHGQAPLAC